MKWKKGKATTLNELYNIPCFNGIPLLSAPFIDDRASLPKVKEKHNLIKSEMKERESSYFEWVVYNIPCLNGLPFTSTPLIDAKASLPKSQRKMKFW